MAASARFRHLRSIALFASLMTITAAPGTSVYGAPLATPTVTYSGFINGDGPANLTIQPTVINSATAGSPVGSYILTPGGALSSTYTIQYVNGAYTITPATLTVTSDTSRSSGVRSRSRTASASAASSPCSSVVGLCGTGS